MERRLAAIMAADVVGYSRLIRADEEGTIVALKALRADLIDPKIAEHHGRIVKLMGDGMLAEFGSVVDAVRAAVETQQRLSERNAGLPVDKRIEFRIGINLGDVVIDGDDIQGDGVNVAARLEALAEPGGICVSGMVYDQVRDRIDLVFEDLGEQELKNIDRPVRVWRWVADRTSVAADLAQADGPLPLPDKPSIAVLPFDNMSGDPEQEYFADGITEDIITALSRVGWFFVIARNSSFTYKGKAGDIKQISRELGVRYVLEGSVRKASGRVRISVQLIDATTGNHLWADRYDGLLDDVFDLQDQITENVVGAIEPKLRLAEIERTKRKRPDNLDAYDYFLRALPHIAAMSADSNREAMRLLARATEIDSRYAPALGYSAWCRAFARFFGWSQDRDADAAEGMRLAQDAINANPEDPIALRAAAMSTVVIARDYEGARTLIDRSLAVDSNSSDAWGVRGWINAWDERNDEAMADFGRATRLSPFDTLTFLSAVGMAYTKMIAGRYDEASSWARQGMQRNPEWAGPFRLHAAASAHLGRMEEAQAAAARVLELEPEFTLSTFAEVSPWKGGMGFECYLDGLRKAGFR